VSDIVMTWQKRLSHYLYFFSFLFLLDLQLQDGAWESIMWLCHNVTIGVMDCHVTVTVTVCHMTRVTWGPWESKCIATVVKCISSRELSENSIEFSLSNSEQRDSWLNSGHQTLDTDSITKGHLLVLWWTEYRFKSFISRVRQATKDVVKSEV